MATANGDIEQLGLCQLYTCPTPEIHSDASRRRAIDADLLHSTLEPLQPLCQLYICPTPEIHSDASRRRAIDADLLHSTLEQIGAADRFAVTQTSCGFVVDFCDERDIESLLEKNLAKALGGPVLVARIQGEVEYLQQQENCHLEYYKPGIKAVIICGVSWAIPLEDILAALTRQGINASCIQRVRNLVRVEVLDDTEHKSLLADGVDFFGATTFCVHTERSPPNSVLQCFRCQGFWHVAAHCHNKARCVRCGDTHKDGLCTRAKPNPTCCHCAGPHHAADKSCPVRRRLEHATPVNITLTTGRNKLPPKMWEGSHVKETRQTL